MITAWGQETKVREVAAQSCNHRQAGAFGQDFPGRPCLQVEAKRPRDVESSHKAHISVGIHPPNPLPKCLGSSSKQGGKSPLGH